ncbi:translation initiation factor IF-3 [Pelagibius litoralis]|uniref:Translation initiation factor IF-3 n=1 Tax=Pelagibius litoralis TaxID=374515 RepID=A0A967EWR2_9PROT|nr:translation initiation factor IF-3 [Pelagibius litoralis]NIA67938.1 translation initiation factor IF-3 [Pelagibius litoralis]
MARPPFDTTPSRDGPRVNELITVPQVRLVDENGEQVGVVSTVDALSRAMAAGMDLMEVSPNADPPVCKILDYGRFRYEAQKKKNEARKKQKTIDVKEIKMRPNIDTHDYEVKMRAIHRFIGEGDKVKVTMRFRGREMVHQEIGKNVLDRVREEMEETAKVEQFPKLEGRQMTMVMAPR